MSAVNAPDHERAQYVLILPTYNERETLPLILERILRASKNVDVLVIDDSSPDGTAEIARTIQAQTTRVDVLVRPEKLGLGSAYIRGFMHGIANGYRGVCTMDADNSHDPHVLPKMIDALAACDMVIGSRYVSGGSTNQSVIRKINSAVANTLARVMLDIPVRDCTSGYRMYSTAILEKLPLGELQSRGYSVLVEMLCYILDNNGRVRELPISFVDRSLGESKIGLHEILESVRTMARLRRGRFGPLRTHVANALYSVLTFKNKPTSVERKF